VAAAEAAPPAQRVALLRAALLVAPSGLHDWLRLHVFQAERAVGNDQQASVAVTPLLPKLWWLRNTTPAAMGPADDADAADTVADPSADIANEAIQPTGTQNATQYVANTDLYSLSAALASDSDKLAFALSLAAMDQRLGDDQRAAQDLQAATRLSSDKTQQVALTARALALRSRLAIARDNAARRPIIQDSIEQTMLVRPRLRTGAAEVQP
jgi:hypothetical protein